MTVLRALTRASLESETVPLTDATLAEWLTGATADTGVAVTERRVLGLPTYYRAAVTTATAIATLPLKVYKAGSKEKLAQRTVLDAPNPRQTQVEWRVTSMLHAITWGNAFHRKLRDGSGTVREVWPLHPSRVRLDEEEPNPQNRSGKLFWVRDRHGVEHRYTDADILHLPFVSYDGVAGVRPLELFRQSLGIAIAGDDSTARFLKNGSRLSGILTTDKDLDDTTATRLRRRWKELTGGVANSGEIGILDNGAKFEPVSLPPGDAQLLEGRQWSVSEVARMVGTPPHLVGDVDRSTSWGAGIEEQKLNWLQFTLQLWITSMEQRYDAELLPSIAYSKHKLEGFLRGDSKARAELYRSGIVNGWMSRNEVRELEDLEPVDGLDEFIVPSNMTLISVDGEILPLSQGSTDPGAAG
ncbi:MAG TPA: phage portal protein [Aquihabitans sp.]|nr:phage portal protein [Aquihabitans sp.]